MYPRCVCNDGMRSVGERIRQARTYRGLSGEELARRVGYKHQSAIGNLEARAIGSGGTKIVQIAQALDCSVLWLLNGPDTDDMANVPPFAEAEDASGPGRPAAEVAPPAYLPARGDRASASTWPFTAIAPAQYARLSLHQRALVEGFVLGLLHEDAGKSPAAANG